MLASVRQALERGFIRETQALVKYLIFAQKAEEEAKSAAGEKEKQALLEVADLFRKIAEEEMPHALFYLKAIDELGNTAQNLQASIEGERNDHVEYMMCAGAARAEGLEDIARSFERIAEIEKRHTELFTTVSQKMQNEWFQDRMKQI